MSTHVRDAYDKGARNTTSVAERQNSRTIHLRQFNNWIKAILVQKYCPEPYAAILDVACGRGGDIPKWKRKNPNQFVFGDISIDSLKEAYKKYRAVKCACRAFFLGGDIFGCRVKDFIPENMRFHISSCQFALHYSFRDEEYATNAVRNLTELLLPGGYVILTVPNACRIVKMLREHPENPVIQNSLYRIERHFEVNGEIPAFGAEYVFDLVESVDNCSEYLVHPAVLESLFRKFNCKLQWHWDFHEFYWYALDYEPAMKDLYLELLGRLDMANADMTPDEWEVISLYSFYVFRKDFIPGKIKPGPQKPEYNEPKRNEFDIMNVEDSSIIHVSINDED